MGGLYLHIPFCRQACRYCDFFFSVSLRYRDGFVEQLVREIRMRGRERAGEQLDTLYLGGGTPSLLSPGNLERILEAVYGSFTFRANAEVTMECNPDDLDRPFLDRLMNHGFNRLSIGVQSFHDRDLQLMRRSHNAEQAERSVKNAAEAGFENITMDLIYGIPGQSALEWEANLTRAISMPVAHLSAYHLTFEEGTVFDHWRRKGRLVPLPEEESLQHYALLREHLKAAGFDHYEISNFARGGKMSEHNLIYWNGSPYLGMGPSAHSFDGTTRSWNTASLKGYMEGIEAGTPVREVERLTTGERYHDYLITSLRTRWGAEPDHILHHFGEAYRNHFDRRAALFLGEGSMQINGKRVAIHPDRWLITDHILRELFTGEQGPS